MTMQRIGGTIYVQVNGDIYDAKGSFTYNIGRPKREGVVGVDRVHGFKERPQIGFIEGEFTDRKELKLSDVLDAVDATVTIALANGKTIAIDSAYYAGDGTGNTDEGNFGVRYEGDAYEVPA